MYSLEGRMPGSVGQIAMCLHWGHAHSRGEFERYYAKCLSWGRGRNESLRRKVASRVELGQPACVSIGDTGTVGSRNPGDMSEHTVSAGSSSSGRGSSG
jgi:hypothetical protein